MAAAEMFDEAPSLWVEQTVATTCAPLYQLQMQAEPSGPLTSRMVCPTTFHKCLQSIFTAFPPCTCRRCHLGPLLC